MQQRPAAAKVPAWRCSNYEQEIEITAKIIGNPA